MPPPSFRATRNSFNKFHEPLPQRPPRHALRRQPYHFRPKLLRVRSSSGCPTPDPDIPAANLSTLFDPLRSKSGSATGTGLGLPLCHAILKLHAGAIEAESTPGKGATFTVRLDLTEP